MPKKSNPGESLNTKEKILQEAVVQFAAHGYDGTSLEKIARACHPPMTAQHCAYHFSNKDALYVEAYKEACRIWTEALEANVPMREINSFDAALASLYQIVRIFNENEEEPLHASGVLTVSEFLAPREILHPCLRDLLMPFGYRVMTILDRLRPDLSNADYSKIMKAIFGLVLYPKLSKGMAPFIGGKAVYDKALVDVTMQMVLLVIYAPRLPVSVNLEHMIPSMAPMFPFPVKPSEPRPQFQGAEPNLAET